VSIGISTTVKTTFDDALFRTRAALMPVREPGRHDYAATSASAGTREK
jgi:hypothetical protein